MKVVYLEWVVVNVSLDMRQVRIMAHVGGLESKFINMGPYDERAYK